MATCKWPVTWLNLKRKFSIIVNSGMGVWRQFLFNVILLMPSYKLLFYLMMPLHIFHSKNAQNKININICCLDDDDWGNADWSHAIANMANTWEKVNAQKIKPLYGLNALYLFGTFPSEPPFCDAIRSGEIYHQCLFQILLSEIRSGFYL